MPFNISIVELLIISLLFVTALNCTLTYFCCTKSLKVLEENNSIGKAVNKLRIFDQYILSKINILVALLYFIISYFFVNTYLNTYYVFFFACLLSFVLTLITTFVSRLCYCYTCNVLLETKLNEFECLVINFKNLMSFYFPFLLISLLVPSIYLFEVPMLYRNIICIASLLVIVVIWIILAPDIIKLKYNAKRIPKNTMLEHRLMQLLDAHGIKRYKLYYWDTSRSKEANAMVSGIRKHYLFISSYLVESVTLPELETILTHEIGHIKNKHVIKMMIGKIFLAMCILSAIMEPFIFKFNTFNKILFYFASIIIITLEMLIAVAIERKYEKEADYYASCYNDPNLFANALKKVTPYEEEDNSIDELFQTHPSIKNRIDNINK